MDLEQRERERFKGRAGSALSDMPTQRLNTLFEPLLPVERLTTHVEL